MYDTNIYIEPDGSKWWRVFRHNNPSANGLFSSTDDFIHGVKKSDDVWFEVGLAKEYDIKEYLVKQKLTSSDTEVKYRLTQTVNAMDATYNNTVQGANVVYNTSAGYSTPNYRGGLRYNGSETYLCWNNGSSTQWWGAIGSWSDFSNGIPSINQGTITTGYLELYIPAQHVFNGSKSSIKFNSIGGSDTVIVNSETTWTATTNSNWLNISPTTGSNGNTTVTISAGEGDMTGSRNATITFTDADEFTFDVDVFQLKLGMKVYVNRYKVGSTNIVKQQSGADNVKKMYMGNDLVYQKFAFSPKLSINVDSMVFKYSGDTAQSVTVNSNTNWNYTTDVNWLTLTKDSNTLSVLPDDYTSELENRTATITITADNGDIVKTKTISVTQKKVATYTQLEWIRAVNTGTGWDSNAKLNTMVQHTTTDMVIRFKYKWQPNYSSGYSDRMVGYSYQFNDDIATSLYRIFAYSNGSFDNLNDRTSYLNLMTSNQYYDITFADNYVYDNINNTYLSNKTPVGSVPTLGCKIFVDLSFPIYGVEIKNGNTLVFDGVPGMDDDGHVGLWDNVSGQLFYNPNYTMTYGEL